MTSGTKTIKHTRIAQACHAIGLTLLVALFLLPAAAPAASEWDLPALMKELAAQGPRQAPFTEEKHISLLNQTLTLKGTLHFHSADALEKRVTQPRAERYAIDGDTLEITRGDQATRELRLSDYPPLEGFIASLRDTLAGNQEALEQHYRLSLNGDAGDWQLQLEPRQRRLRAYIQQITIRGSGGQVRRFELYEPNGDHSLLRIEHGHD